MSASFADSCLRAAQTAWDRRVRGHPVARRPDGRTGVEPKRRAARVGRAPGLLLMAVALAVAPGAARAQDVNFARYASSTKLFGSWSDTAPLTGDQKLVVPITSWPYQGQTYSLALTYHSVAQVDPLGGPIPLFAGLGECDTLSGSNVAFAGNGHWTHNFAQWIDYYQLAGTLYAAWHRGDGSLLCFPYNGSAFSSLDSYHTITASGPAVTSPNYDCGGPSTTSAPATSFAIKDAEGTEYDFNQNLPPSNPNQQYLFWTSTTCFACPHYLLSRIKDRWNRTLYVNWSILNGLYAGQQEPRVTTVTDPNNLAFLTFNYSTPGSSTPSQISPLLVSVTDAQGRMHSLAYTDVQGFTGSAAHPKLTSATVYGPGAGPGNTGRQTLSWSFGYADASNGYGLSSPSYGGTYTGDLVIRMTDPAGLVWNYSYEGVTTSQRSCGDGTDWDGRISQISWTDSSEGSPVTKTITRTLDSPSVARITMPGGAASTFTYDASDNLTAVKDISTGRMSSFTFDGFHNLTTVRSPTEQGTTNPLVQYAYTFSPSPHVSQITKTVLQADGSLGDPVTTQLNTLNDPTSEVATHRTAGLTDQVASYVYDNGTLTVGNLTSVVRDATMGGFNLTTNTAYAGTAGSFGLPTSQTDAAIGATSTTIYDPSHGYLPCSSQSPPNLSLPSGDPDYPASTSTTLFNADNLPSLVRDPMYAVDSTGHYTAITYAPQAGNAANLVTTTTDADNHTVVFTTDPFGRTLQAVDQNGYITQTTYNPQGQVKTVTEAAGTSDQRVTTYHYNAQGDLSAIDPTNGTSGTITYEYTGTTQAGASTGIYEGQVTHIHYPATSDYPTGTDEYFGYEPSGGAASASAGELTWRKRPTGGIVTLSYDQLHRVSQVSYPTDAWSGPFPFSVSYTYDEFGRTTSQTRTEEGAPATTTFTYDALNRTASATPPAGNGQLGQTYTYTADAVNHRWTSTMTPSGMAAYQYFQDTKGRLAQEINPFNQSFTMGYDLEGKNLRVTYNGGAKQLYSYNHLDQLSSATIYDAMGTPRDNFLYAYDPASHLTSEQDTSDGNHMFGYNRRYELTSESQLATGSIAYTYDLNGNRITRSAGGATDYYSYDAANKLQWVNQGTNTQPSLSQITPFTQFYYDPNGRRYARWKLYSAPVASSSQLRYTSYDWDGDDRMRILNGRFGAAGSGAPYYSPNYDAYYDGNGLRNQFQDGYEPGQPYHTVTRGPDGVFYDTATSGTNTTFTPGFEQHVGTTDSYTMSDWQGNTRYMPDATGMNFGTYLRYDAFGQRTSASANWYPSPCMYGGDAGYSTTYSTMTGGTWEPGIELQYLEQRYYDPSIGRFISPDPLGVAGGLNQYEYSDDDPANEQDPSGLAPGDYGENYKYTLPQVLRGMWDELTGRRDRGRVDARPKKHKAGPAGAPRAHTHARPGGIEPPPPYKYRGRGPCNGLSLPGGSTYVGNLSSTQIAVILTQPGTQNVVVDTAAQAVDAANTAFPGAVWLPPAIPFPTGVTFYPEAPPGALQTLQVQPPEYGVGNVLPHVKYEDWSGGKKGRGGRWGHIFFCEPF